jgi:hypothetical protein
MADKDNDFVTFRLKSDTDEQPEWRIVSKIKLVYSEENGNEPDTIYILQPVLSGFEQVADDAPKAFAVLEDEFDDILSAVEG